MNAIMRSKDLKHLTIVELRRLAKKVKVSPKRTMTKDQLIKAIILATRSRAISETLKKKKASTKKAINKAVALKSQQTPSPTHRRQVYEETLPVYKGINRVVLMPRDPWWIFAYWEVDKTIVSVDNLILRLYRQGDKLYASINVGSANNWYVNMPEPSDTIRAELGYMTHDKGFIVIAVSNIIKTPRAWPSDISYTGSKEPTTTQKDNPFIDAYSSYERENPYIRQSITSRKW